VRSERREVKGERREVRDTAMAGVCTNKFADAGVSISKRSAITLVRSLTMV
jgi:hypothetical protein